MGTETIWTGEAIIADALGRAPDVQLGGGAWQLSRWRQFVGTYKLPPLPDPIFVVHIAGNPNVRMWDRDCWSTNSSSPGCATIVPSGQPTGWLVDGELDVVTLSLASDTYWQGGLSEHFKRMRFAFSDPLGVALTRQVLGELYAPASAERDAYVDVLMNALQAHMLRGPTRAVGRDIPSAQFSAFRLHKAMNAILQHPGEPHRLDEIAAEANVSPSHFCRIFKQASGMSPHQYVMKARLERAQQLLLHSDMSVLHISETLGFASQSHFSRAFRRFSGTAPLDSRKRGRARLQ